MLRVRPCVAVSAQESQHHRSLDDRATNVTMWSMTQSFSGQNPLSSCLLFSHARPRATRLPDGTGGAVPFVRVVNVV